jgi:hypothetical protein
MARENKNKIKHLDFKHQVIQHSYAEITTNNLFRFNKGAQKIGPVNMPSAEKKMFKRLIDLKRIPK